MERWVRVDGEGGFGGGIRERLQVRWVEVRVGECWVGAGG